jgi:hypothetical protein
VDPDSISTVSPFISNFTGPEGERRAFACSKIVTKARITSVKTTTLDKTTSELDKAKNITMIKL